MRRNWTLPALLLLSTFAVAVDGSIMGTLVNEHGVPIPDMGVQAHRTDTGFDGILFSATTDSRGKFVIKVRGLPEGITEHWEVYPFDGPKGFYPRPRSFFRNNIPAPNIVELSPEAPRASTQITLGPMVGALRVRVLGALGSDIIPTFDIAWESGIESLSVTFSGPRDSYRLLLPANFNVTLKVAAPGYKPWQYAGVISAGSGQEVTLDIQLGPENSSAK